MKKYAVVGTGAIGSLVGGYISRAGYDITLISTFRREKAQLLNREGLCVSGNGDDFHTRVKSVYIDDLTTEQYDVIFLGLKSNDLEKMVGKLLEHLAPGGCLIPLGNGINDDIISGFVGMEQVVIGVTFAGGHMIEANHVEGHDGNFWIGEIDGTITLRAEEIARVLSAVRPAKVTDQIRKYQWDKLARVCLSVPTATITGLYLGDVFCDLRLQKLFALLALELFKVSKADGFPLDNVEDKSEKEWNDVLNGRLTGLEGRVDDWPPNVVDAYTADIQAGRPLEIEYTNGAVVKLGKKYGIPTPINQYMIDSVLKIRDGKEVCGFHMVNRALALAGY